MKTAAGISILLGQYNEMEIAYHSPASPTNTTKRKENTTFNTTTQWRILPKIWPVWLDSILLLEVQFGRINETTEKCS